MKNKLLFFGISVLIVAAYLEGSEGKAKAAEKTRTQEDREQMARWKELMIQSGDYERAVRIEKRRDFHETLNSIPPYWLGKKTLGKQEEEEKH